jgi:PTH1 family peptidyl-tRNA hydrolase
VALLKPQTFMNRSGRSVCQAMKHLSLAPQDLVVIHDELDLEPGTIRVKVGGGSGGHRGLESCFLELGTRELVRVRVGIGRPQPGRSATDYVLEPFDDEQREHLPEIVNIAADAAREAATASAAAAMNRFNRRSVGVGDGGDP